MIELQWIRNEVTRECRLYYRYKIFTINASGSYNYGGHMSEWKVVEEKTLEEASYQDLQESGGICDAP